MNNFSKEELNKIIKVLKSGIFSSRFGNVTGEFEKEFAKKFKVKYAIAMNSGTSTLHSAIVSCRVENGDEVIVPAISVVCVAAAIIHANCVPVFVDVDKKTFNIDPQDMERKITKKTKVIIPVSMFGLSSEMDEVMEIAKKYKLKVIEDSAMNFLGIYKGRLAGTTGDFGSFSFEQTKHMATGDGGILTTNDKKFAIRARQVADHGYKFMSAYGRIKNKPPVFEYIGWNYRMTEISSVVGLIKLKKLDKLVENRIKSANMYNDIIKNYSIFQPQFVPGHIKHSYYRYAVVFKGREKDKENFLDIINSKMNIASLWFRPIYLEPSLRKFNFSVRCPVARKIGNSIITLKTDFNTEIEKELAVKYFKKAIQSIY